MTGATLGPACGVFGCVVGGAGGSGVDVTAAADSVGACSILDDPGPVCTGVNASTDGAGVDALGTVVTGIVAFGVRSGAGLEVDLFRPIVIELMDSELTAVGGIRVADRPSGTDGERDTSVTSVAVTAGAVMGTDPEEL